MPVHTRHIPTLEDPVIAGVAAQLAAVGESIDIVALTTDETLLAILREGAGTARRILHATTAEQAGELIISARVGVIVIDTLATGENSEALCEQLRAQFPDLVLIVAGTTDDQTQLIKQLTAGDIYRFLHKPVSPPRARQFLEAAVRRHLEGRTFTPADITPPKRGLVLPKVFLGIGLAAIVAIAAAFFFFAGDHRETTPEPIAQRPAPAASPRAASPPAPASDERSKTLTAALAALEAGRLIAPPGESAADLYRHVLASQPGDAEAEAGLDRIADQLLTDAETAMLEERVEDAARAIEDARSVRPNNMRLAFLSAQLGKERERRLIALARQSAEAGNYARAATFLERAAQGQKTPSAVLLHAQREIEQRRAGSSVENLLKRANDRLQRNQLIAPQGNSAETYILAAVAADPGNAAAQQARRALADQTLTRARQALADRDFTAAEEWLTHAESLGGSVRALRRELDAARRSSARSDQQAQLVARLDERIRENRFTAPARDNAAYYWRELRSVDPQNARLQTALPAIGAGLVQQARTLLASGDAVAAQTNLDEAKALGFVSPELTALELQVAESVERAAFLDNVISAATLARDKYVEPRYPLGAQRKGIGGWVELDFTIGVDGIVKDLVVHAADPVDTFEAAALKAVAQWRYKPIMRNGRAVEQRARLRMRFAIEQKSPGP